MKVHGFYAIVDTPALVDAVLAGGAAVVQLRMKRATTREFLDAAREVRRKTRAAGVPFVVNDRLDVALIVEADGVHLGQDDLPFAAAHAALAACGRSLAVGVSTHNLAQAVAAAHAGADYLGFGPVFATTSKENPDPVQGLETLAEVVRAIAPLPVVAIGGVTPARAREVAATGVAAAAVISAVNQAQDVVAAARAMSDVFRVSSV